MDEAEAFQRDVDAAMMDGATEHPGFEVGDDHAANWCLRKLAGIEAARGRRQAFVTAEVERLTAWQAREDAKGQRFAEFLTSQLRGYFDRVREMGLLGRAKSYVLPHGRLSVRAVPPQYDRTDDAALLAWAKARDLVRVREEVAWDLVKVMLAPASNEPLAPVIDVNTKEVVPGVRVKQHAGEVFSAKPDVGSSREVSHG